MRRLAHFIVFTATNRFLRLRTGESRNPHCRTAAKLPGPRSTPFDRSRGNAPFKSYDSGRCLHSLGHRFYRLDVVCIIYGWPPPRLVLFERSAFTCVCVAFVQFHVNVYAYLKSQQWNNVFFLVCLFSLYKPSLSYYRHCFLMMRNLWNSSTPTRRVSGRTSWTSRSSSTSWTRHRCSSRKEKRCWQRPLYSNRPLLEGWEGQEEGLLLFIQSNQVMERENCVWSLIVLSDHTLTHTHTLTHLHWHTHHSPHVHGV